MSVQKKEKIFWGVLLSSTAAPTIAELWDGFLQILNHHMGFFDGFFRPIIWFYRETFAFLNKFCHNVLLNVKQASSFFFFFSKQYM